uniref:LCCL domain-containing protein n=1 Tax=Neobodo designis TaxID=312471 RepID=A0A7S1MH63_NEODS
MGNAPSAEQLAKYKNSSLPCTSYEAGYEGQVFCDGRCEQQGTVWGTGPYVADSCVCRAARHAGVIQSGSNPGCFKVVLKPGADKYDGSEAHGVKSYSCAQATHSITFEKVEVK